MVLFVNTENSRSICFVKCHGRRLPQCNVLLESSIGFWISLVAVPNSKKEAACMIASLSLDKNSVVQVGFGKSDAWHEASLCIKLDGLLHNCTVDMLLFTFSASHQDNPLSDFGFLPSLVKWSNFFFFFFSFFFEIKHLSVHSLDAPGLH